MDFNVQTPPVLGIDKSKKPSFRVFQQDNEVSHDPYIDNKSFTTITLLN